MTFVSETKPMDAMRQSFASWGLFWLLVACLGAGLFFVDGLDALLAAWALPEYSHGPLIPVLSLLLFLRQLKEYPVEPGSKSDRWVGVGFVLLAILMATAGKLANISDIVAYATIIWIGGVLLVSFGWRTGKHFWPPVLHLVYMLPLPGVFYYKISTYLQFVSSELGVWFLQLLSIPVFLEGNIIDLGVLKLHVAEACSGLRYLFPILSFSYIFAVLYKGPTWHKAVLLLAAVPITILMNSVRIAVAGVIAQHYGIEWLDGFTHFFEGWVIFLACIILLFALAWVMLKLQPRQADGRRMSLVDALDLDTDGLVPQAMRITYVRASKAMITVALAMVVSAASWYVFVPERGAVKVPRESFVSFPRALGDWQQVGPREVLDPTIVAILGSDDYVQANYAKPGATAPVGLFVAWYYDQSQGGVHSPEICLPSAGWEIAWLERTDVSETFPGYDRFEINRAIIQKGEARMMVYYWFDQKGQKIAWDFAAKFQLLVDGVRTGRTDGALVRLTTAIGPHESDAEAEARLREMLAETLTPLPRFVPEG